MTEMNMSSKEMAGWQTKKVWEKVIGDKHNSNSEINHIAQHWALVNTGMAQVTTPKQGQTTATRQGGIRKRLI